MDKNTLIGFLLILGIMVGFSYLNRPSEEELERQRVVQDSLQRVAMQEQAMREADFMAAQELKEQTNDSVKASMAGKLYGDFAQFTVGEKKDYTLENELIKVTISNKGGCVSSVELKNYTTNDGRKLMLFDESDAQQNLTFVTANNRVIDTKELYFKAVCKGD
ncbi:MAG: YidC/Oxa1 family insertase periplasmic-domain containing protein, partial [Paludibacteraceae bacterium]|nr:YidC/Oxa1 family insertase periplasmic-domain containing protein [Paludibacteraceae bacterium]